MSNFPLPERVIDQLNRVYEWREVGCFSTSREIYAEYEDIACLMEVTKCENGSRGGSAKTAFLGLILANMARTVEQGRKSPEARELFERADRLYQRAESWNSWEALLIDADKNWCKRRRQETISLLKKFLGGVAKIKQKRYRKKCDRYVRFVLDDVYGNFDVLTEPNTGSYLSSDDHEELCDIEDDDEYEYDQYEDIDLSQEEEDESTTYESDSCIDEDTIWRPIIDEEAQEEQRRWNEEQKERAEQHQHEQSEQERECQERQDALRALNYEA